ncbi:MAG TPA: IPT/TIG domain-containing protein [Solirubrobacteraceae bacterium]|jgi:alpha-tubulin suppressor-like RCC1 family protein|nr:IPT/TIG domain-containing protein [Solirubrobacteraceae bacterium]
MTRISVAALLAAATLLATLGAASTAWATNGAAGWGAGGHGQLGNGTTAKRGAPTTVVELAEVQSVSAGTDFSLALMKNGTVEAWGGNENGQLGDGTTHASQVPVTVSGLHEVVEVAAGGEFGLARLADGKVMAWGRNERGQLGDGGSEVLSDVPVEVSGLSEVSAIAASKAEGFGFGLALLKNGTVKAWGANSYGALGNGSEEAIFRTPTEVSELTEVVAVAAGANDGLALLANGTVKAWGLNSSGQLGNGTETGPDNCEFGFTKQCWRTPTTTTELSEVASISAGESFGVAVLAGGTVKSWGSNADFQLGREPKGKQDVPGTVKELSEVTQASAGDHHVLALLANGTVKAWGDNESEELGIGSSESSVLTPTRVGELSGVEGVSAGSAFSLSFGSPGPIVSRLEPTQGATGGGTEVKITGSNLTGLKAVDFGTSAASFSVSSSTSATATSPAAKPSTVTVKLVGANGILSAPGSASEFTYVPEGELQFGRCSSVGAGKGRFKTGTCTELAEGGKFEWTPGAIKASFTIADATTEKGAAKEISLASGHATLSCGGASGSGAYLGEKAVTNVTIVFTGCTLGGSKCSSAGAAEGEVDSFTLEGGLGYREKSANTVGLDLRPSGEAELVLEAVCGSSTVRVRGAAIAALSPVNKMTASFTLHFKTSKGVQSPEHFEGEADEFYELSVGAGAYEQAALSFEANTTNEESLEVNTTV